MKKSTIACTLAASLRKNDNTLSLSAAMKQAWEMVNHTDETFFLLTFVKVDQTVCKRIVSKDWSKYNEPKGTGRPVKDGLCLFADMGKVLTGRSNSVISAYESKIVELQQVTGF